MCNMDNRTITVSEHVVFDETIFPCRKNRPGDTDEDDECISFSNLETITPSLKECNNEDSTDLSLENDKPEDESVENEIMDKTTRYPIRERTVPSRYSINAYRMSSEDDMTTLYMAMESEDAAKWKDEIDDELRSLE